MQDPATSPPDTQDPGTPSPAPTPWRAADTPDGARHRRPAAASLETVLVGDAPGGRRLTAFVP
ncbi:hypothetical protein ACWCRC_32410, partial [Streptomyces sp. NPDC001940]